MENQEFYTLNNTMKNILLILSSLISFVSISQTYTLSAYVFDENNETIPFANIYLTGKNEFKTGATTDFNGMFVISNIPKGIYNYKVSYLGYVSKIINNFKINNNIIDSIFLNPSNERLEEIVVTGYRTEYTEFEESLTVESAEISSNNVSYFMATKRNTINYSPNFKTKADFTPNPDFAILDSISNDFIETKNENTSTFSIDVDNASYTHLRNTILNYHQIPDSLDIRIEEMINYFDYNYPKPKSDKTFSVYSEIGNCPWDTKAKLLQIGIQGKDIDYNKLANSNLVFLIDVSGSMGGSIELIKKSLSMLVDKLTKNDKVSIVVYAGAAGLVLPATTADQKEKIKLAINNLSTGGSTAGGAGINLAYKIAKENYKKGENNRVILCTDGDFNVGVSSKNDLDKLIERKRKDKIFLSVCGFGYALNRDKEMESLADKGNGNYYFIDSEKEANNVFVKKMRSTLFTIAKDFKIQMIFNEEAVKSYRLIGYTNRKLENKDFNNDKKDAGELGAGQNVTALYELILNRNSQEEDLAEIKLRFKQPESSKSKLFEYGIKNKPSSTHSTNFIFSTAVASFGMLLEKNNTANILDLEKIIAQAEQSISLNDKENREEFVSIMKAYLELIKK